MTLDDVVAAAAADLDLVAGTPTANGGMEYRVGDRSIAVVIDGVGEFRLDTAVAAAARRTPDAGASDRGPDWVRFAPEPLDEHAADRARAWLVSAARLGGG